VSNELGRAGEWDPGELAAFGPFQLIPAARRLERGGVPVEVGGRALDVLIALVSQPGRVVGKAELMSAIWPDITVVEGVLRTHVYNLRKALGDGEGGARYVTSVAGRGYCFVAPVVRGTSEAKTSVPPSAWKLAHGLPPRLARMAGRDDAIPMLAAQLAQHRFVTVLGPAGIGKTTVAVAVGHALLDDFGGAVRFIELGALTDPALVAATVASTLGVPMHADEALESLQAFLQDKRVLLVLDNCEHVVQAVASLAEHLFLRAPQVHLLTTSREALRVEGERAHRLGPLGTPTETLGLDAETVQTFPAVQVFLERAAAAGWSGELTDDDVPIVAETCRRVDGVPLAIELAASFAGRYGLQGVAAVLDDHLRLLWQRGRRTAPPRQKTLHALVAWSYDRLPELERIILRRFSVFVGTFSFDAARAVVLDGGDATESLPEVVNMLVGKSLLSASVEDGAVVYRLLETTRVYALERLAESGELERTSLRHAILFAARLEQATDVTRPEHARSHASDLGNVRAALKWCFSSAVGHTTGTRLAAAAARRLLDLGLVAECRDVCRRALDVMGEHDAGTLVELGLQEAWANSAMFARGLDQEVHMALNRGVELARRLGGGDHEVRLLAHLTFFLIKSGDYRRGLEVAEQNGGAARLASTAGKITSECWLGVAHSACGHQPIAQSHLEESLRLAATVDPARAMRFSRSVAMVTLARTLWLQGQPDRAAAVARQTIDEITESTDAVEKCLRLTYGEIVFVWRGEWGEAARLVDMLTEHVERYSIASYRGVAMALSGELLVKTGRPKEGCSRLRIADSTLKAARNAANDTAFAGALAEGLAATGSLDEALVTVQAAIELAYRRGGTWDLPELLRLKGALLASRSSTDPRAVDDMLSSAIDLARRQGAFGWELRAATTLAHERLRRGGRANEFGELAAVYARFTEGMDTPDLQAATRLLDPAALDSSVPRPKGTPRG
jgi:predicted ATPase/DNA-binding winged helix-turn-helix (wHTH) protein